MTIAIRCADSTEGAAISETLADAFAEDPIMGWILSDARNDHRHRLGMFVQAARVYQRDGVAHVTPGFEAAALWGSPNPPPRPWLDRILDDLHSLIASLRSAGPGLKRAIQLYQTMGRHRPEEPHWYLAAIGTRAAARGQGAASSLLAHQLAQCDAETTLAYLESSNPANIPLYRRHGFEVTGEFRVADSPPLWPMLRAPRE